MSTSERHHKRVCTGDGTSAPARQLPSNVTKSSKSHVKEKRNPCLQCINTHLACTEKQILYVDPGDTPKVVFDDTGKNRFQCDACLKRRNNTICSRSAKHVAFYASDFVFKHQLVPCVCCVRQPLRWCGRLHDNGKDIDVQPDIRNPANAMLYLYTEHPYESRAAWSPLFVRKEFATEGGSPFLYTPMLTYPSCLPADVPGVPNSVLDVRRRDLNDEQSFMVRKMWKVWGDKQADRECRPPCFAVGENVLTCRRICSLLGILDLANTLQSVLKISIRPGTYRIVWRLQFFSSDLKDLDEKILIGGRSYDPEQETAEFASCVNPFNFPVWKTGQDHDIPHRPALCLSAGYARSVHPTDLGQIDYSTGHELFAHQVLLPAQEDRSRRGTQDVPDTSTRVDHWIDQGTFFENVDYGWIESRPAMYFSIVDGKQPTFVFSAIDSGNWIGGFRFGGVHLEAVDTP